MRASRAGFTVVEATAAIGIVCIGVFMVCIVSAPGRSLARNSSCSSNLKQIALGMQMYATDNGGTLPPRYDAFGSLAPYLKNTMIVRCPESEPNPGSSSDQYASDYILRPSVHTDDVPGIVVVGDDAPDRHWRRRWIGARLDGAVFLWHASEWEGKLGDVVKGQPARPKPAEKAPRKVEDE